MPKQVWTLTSRSRKNEVDDAIFTVLRNESKGCTASHLRHFVLANCKISRVAEASLVVKQMSASLGSAVARRQITLRDGLYKICTTTTPKKKRARWVLLKKICMLALVDLTRPRMTSNDPDRSMAVARIFVPKGILTNRLAVQCRRLAAVLMTFRFLWSSLRKRVMVRIGTAYRFQALLVMCSCKTFLLWLASEPRLVSLRPDDRSYKEVKKNFARPESTVRGFMFFLCVGLVSTLFLAGLRSFLAGVLGLEQATREHPH